MFKLESHDLNCLDRNNLFRGKEKVSKCGPNKVGVNRSGASIYGGWERFCLCFLKLHCIRVKTLANDEEDLSSMLTQFRGRRKCSANTHNSSTGWKTDNNDGCVCRGRWSGRTLLLLLRSVTLALTFVSYERECPALLCLWIGNAWWRGALFRFQMISKLTNRRKTRAAHSFIILGDKIMKWMTPCWYTAWHASHKL